MSATTRSLASVSEGTVYVAFELSQREWKVACSSGFGARPWVQTVRRGDWDGVRTTLAKARARFGLAADAPVASCYEAGREGFWIHRAALAGGLHNRVVDSSSIEVNRRARRAKTDRIDAVKLVQMLVRVCAGEQGVWKEVHVPSVADEATRQVSRERADLIRERTRLANQMRSWLTLQGAAWPSRPDAAWWTTVRDWAGMALSGPLQERLARAQARLDLIGEQIAVLDRAQRAAVAAAPPTDPLRQLVRLKGVAAITATVLCDEGLVWRQFRNRREIGALLGFAPTPFASGDTMREQGISRAGNPRLQATAIELAWNWLRWQPDSALARWYRERFGTGKRARRIGIVALARKVVIALWRWVTAGVVPAGAELRPASA